MGLEYYTPGGLNLTTNDSNRRQSVPESGEGALLAVISEGGASSLKLIDQRDQILHVYGRMDVTEIVYNVKISFWWGGISPQWRFAWSEKKCASEMGWEEEAEEDSDGTPVFKTETE